MKSEKTAIWLKVAITFTFVLGALIFLYPFVVNVINTQVDKGRINKLQTEMKMNEEKLQAKKKKREEEIEKNPHLGMKLENELFEEVEKSSRLSQTEIEEHLIGSISIPRIKSELPIFDTTNSSFLQEGITLLPGSSYPTGGDSTHAVLTGHTGLPNKKLLTDLKDVVEGDKFYIKVLGKTIAYQVNQIKIVSPNDLDDIAIEKGKDYLTLVTCTPYMVNTHRLLVRGERVEIDYEEVLKEEKEIDKKNKQWLFLYGSLIFLLVVLLLYVCCRQYKHYQILKRKYRLSFKLLYKGKAQKGVSLHLKDQSMRHSIKKRNKKIIAKSDRYGRIVLNRVPGNQYWLVKTNSKRKPLKIKCSVKQIDSTRFKVKISKKSDSNWSIQQRKEKKND